MTINGIYMLSCTFRFKFLLLVFFVNFGVFTFPIQSKANDLNLISFSYLNWSERLQLSKADSSVDTPANFAAIGIQYERILTRLQKGWKYSGTLFFGQGSGGRADILSPIPYFASYRPTFGFIGEYGYFTRIGKRLYLEASPILLYRQMQWPEANGVSTVSAPEINLGITFNLRARITKRLDYCQSIGTLFFKASAIWSIGLGYRY
jgi:hypothetical protein